MKLLDSQRLREWSELRSWRNFIFLALDYTCVLLAAGGAVAFHLLRERQGFHWAWEVPVVLLAVFLVGVLQHRIALLGHEASHFLLLRNREWNDRLANLLIFYTLFSDLRLYRKRHAGHHLYPNDHEKDPNLFGGKVERIWARFPMGKQRFARCFYLMFFWPPFVLRNLLDLFLAMTTGTQAGGGAARRRGAALLGRVFFIGMSLVMLAFAALGEPGVPVLAGLFVAAVAVWAWLPQQAFADGDRAANAGALKKIALLKLCCYTLLLLVLAWLNYAYGGRVVVGFVVLWVCPLLYVFPYLMLLREIYQHANAGTGELDNTRVMHVDPVTRWALLAYGNDFHLVHHLYPNIPHERLREVHEVLRCESGDYAAAVMETHGVVSTSADRHSILDSLGA